MGCAADTRIEFALDEDGNAWVHAQQAGSTDLPETPNGWCKVTPEMRIEVRPKAPAEAFLGAVICHVLGRVLTPIWYRRI